MLRIINDRTGRQSLDEANYTVTADINGKVLEDWVFKGFQRSRGWKELLLEVAEAVQ
jgi:hypothetical protein